MNTSLWRTVFFFPLGKLLHSLKIQPASVIRIPADNEHLFLAQSTNSHRKSASLMKDCNFFYFTNFPGGTPLYKPCRCVPSQRVGFFGLFRFENGYGLCPFWSGIGQKFSRELWEGMSVSFILSIPNEWETEENCDQMCELRNRFAGVPIWWDNFLGAGSENAGVKNAIFWSEIGWGFG